MERGYYACSVGEPGKNYVDENLKRIMDNNAFILHGETIQKGVYEDIEKDDVVILKYNKSFIAYGEVVERKKTDDLEWNLWAIVDKWYFKNENHIEGVSIYGINDNTTGGGQYGTVKKLDENFGFLKLKQINANNALFTKINNELSDVKKNRAMNLIVNVIKYKHQIILQGPPGTGKTRLAKDLAYSLIFDKPISETERYDQLNLVENSDQFKLIQFHPAYTYEDFVRGIVAKSESDGIKYVTENKVLASFAKLASENESKSYVLVIDEINRANLPAVLGELIYALEYRGVSVESMYGTGIENDKRLVLPKNLYIIGTMNTADRSVGHIDYAIRRRFAFIDVLVDSSVIINEKAMELFKKVSDLFYEPNVKEEGKNVYLSSDFQAKDVQLGHSYFLADSEEILHLKLKYEIIPILQEYLKDGILKEEAKTVIEDLNK